MFSKSDPWPLRVNLYTVLKSCYDAPQDEIFGNQIGVSSQLGCSDNFNIDPAKIKKDLHLNIKGSFKTNEKI